MRLGLRDTLIAHLKVDYGYTDQQLLALAPILVDPLTPGNGANNVTNRSVQGEFLSGTPALRIGTELPPLTHGDYLAPFDLHSQALLTAFVQSDAFRQMTSSLPALLGDDF